MEKQVILVNEHDVPIGSIEKMEAHEKALLHRAFSVFIFNNKNEMLLQRRALGKYHSAGLWTNACCSHPAPGETTVAAAQRRLFEELGFTVALEEIFEFSYRTAFDNGLTENEYDHVLTGRFDGPVHPDPEEVSEYRFLPMESIRDLLQHEAQQFTSWFHLAFPLVENWMKKKPRELV
jgi:isopentenyl-diphosphate delta-isomerase